MHEELKRALARREDAALRFETADPADRLSLDAAIHELCQADLEVRAVLARARRGAAQP